MKVVKFLISIASCFLVAFLGSIITFPSISDWYEHLNKPVFSPPNWIFGPVWTILYLLMGISLYIVWTKSTNNNKKENAIKIFIFQLILNLLWSLVFFGLRQPFFALITIYLLWISIYLMIKYFHQISKISGYLQIPYLFWVSFASVLNFAIVILNK